MTDQRERWDLGRQERRTEPAIDSFLAEIEEVCRRHDMTIEHEDSQGGFIISKGYGAGSLDRAAIGGNFTPDAERKDLTFGRWRPMERP